MENEAKESKFKKKMKSFFIRLRLLKIWFLKNLVPLIRIGLVVLIAFVISGVLDNEGNRLIASLFASTVNPEDLSLAAKIEYGAAGGVSLLTILFVLFRKTKHITFDDIQSRELKIAMIRERFYFNENGKLCRRLEEKLNQDLDGDNKIVDEEVKDKVVEETVLGSIPRMVGELKDILTVDIDEEEDVVVEKGELNQEQQEVEEKEPEKKEKKRCFLYRLFHKKGKEVIDAAKIAFTEPELNDGMEDDKEKKHWRKLKKNKMKTEEPVEVKEEDNVEIIKQEDSGIIDDVNKIVEDAKNTVNKAKEVVKKDFGKMSNQQKKIEDILSKL